MGVEWDERVGLLNYEVDIKYVNVTERNVNEAELVSVELKGAGFWPSEGMGKSWSVV